MNDITLRARPALDRACKSRCSTLGQNPTWSCWSCLRHCNCSGWVQKKEKKERRRRKKKPKFTTSKILHDLSFEIVASSSPSLLGAIHWKESECTANLRFIFSTRRKEKSLTQVAFEVLHELHWILSLPPELQVPIHAGSDHKGTSAVSEPHPFQSPILHKNPWQEIARSLDQSYFVTTTWEITSLCM